MTHDELRFPAGPFRRPKAVTTEQRRVWIEEIAALPQQLRDAVRGATEAVWNTPYRPGGWTVRQVVHHLPDSHLNAYVRFKLALTETRPTVRPYDEAAWAALPDTLQTAPEVSLQLLESLHARWTTLMRSMDEADFARTLYHPQQQRTLALDEMLALYAWHSRHHLAHVTRVTTSGEAQPAGIATPA
jgi:hypothetical protein